MSDVAIRESEARAVARQSRAERARALSRSATFWIGCAVILFWVACAVLGANHRLMAKQQERADSPHREQRLEHGGDAGAMD